MTATVTCGCEWEQMPDPVPLGTTVPGSCCRRVTTCKQHQREQRIKSDAWNHAEDLAWECNYEGAERALWFSEVICQLEALADDPEGD